MTVILVPATAQFKVYGVIGGIPWNCILHWEQAAGDPPFTVAGLNAASQALYAGLVGQFSTQWPSSVTAQGVSSVDLSTNTPAVGQSTGATSSGSATGLQDNAASYMISLKTADRYRGGHGRVYFPGFATSLQQDSRNWTSTASGAGKAGFDIAVTATNTALLAHGSTAAVPVIPRYTYTYTDDPVAHRYSRKRTAWSHNALVYATVASQLIRTQRRRLG